MTDLMQEIKQNSLEPELWQSLMGIEVESHRINAFGKLSHEPYPSALGSRNYHPNLQTDFGETQTEWITDPLQDDHQLIMELSALHDIFVHEMAESDRLWLSSMPPALSVADRLFVRTHFGRPKYQHYRDYLDGKYGIAHGLTTGIHLNFSLATKLIDTIAKIEGMPPVQINNLLYWRILQNFLKYRWLLTYLFGASPVAETGYFAQMPPELQRLVRSIRNSNIGFNNGGGPHISYTSLTQHLTDLQAAIDTGQLYGQMEFYGPVRIKNQSLIADYATKGIEYLEFRVFDTNPFVPLGIDERELDFVRALLTYCLTEVLNPETIESELQTAAELNNVVALQQPTESLPNLLDAKRLLAEMSIKLTQLKAPDSLLKAVQFYQTQIDHPETTIAAKLVQQLAAGGLTSAILRLTAEQTNTPQTHLPFGTAMQALLAAGLKIGLHVAWPADHDTTIVFRDHDHWHRITPVGPSLAANVHELQRAFPELIRKRKSALIVNQA